MVVVDRLTKYAYFVAPHHLYIAAGVAEAFFNNIFKLHGMPESIVSDRDAVFLNNFWQNLFKLQGVSLQLSRAYHPKTDG